MSESDLHALVSLAQEVKDQSDAASKIVEGFNESVKKSKSKADSGLSFLNLKNFMLLDYMTNLSYLMLKKSFGKKLEGDPCIERMVENRTVIEKMRPIEKKLKYQIDKYLKVADNGFVPENDPLHFKPNLDALDQDDDEDDSGDDGFETNHGEGKKYIPPRHVPAYFEDNDPASVEKESTEKRKKRMLSRGLIDDLKRQHLDTPEEVYDMETVKQSRQAAVEREKIRFEEDNFIRLPLTKQEKQIMRKREMGLTMGRLGDEITHDFGKSNFSSNDSGASKKRKKSSKKKSSSKKKFKKY